ncbi:hypothetical protein EDD68_10630 [Melghiribacillus thermohalophilus]|uniref:Uncharacterized protein n=1 Tax=Melghiribacillus thermohalophilus TaxID=1324956 RepID=A0A4R3N3A7_9BACI|nr:hypothetical protein EDD68_10630 [Melghiribacillus thermohalophilus]
MESDHKTCRAHSSLSEWKKEKKNYGMMNLSFLIVGMIAMILILL